VEELLHGAAREDRAGARGREAVLLGAAARHVVGEDAALAAVHVEPGEERDHGQALHGHAEVGSDHGGQAVRLALQGELGAFDLLEVLQLQLEQLDHLDGQTGVPAIPTAEYSSAGKTFSMSPLCDDVAHGGPAVTGEHHAAGGT